jgi:hypothetical protein
VEALLVMIDAFGLVGLLVMVVKNERRGSGEPQVGPFRYAEKRVKKKLTSRWRAPQ